MVAGLGVPIFRVITVRALDEKESKLPQNCPQSLI